MVENDDVAMFRRVAPVGNLRLQEYYIVLPWGCQRGSPLRRSGEGSVNVQDALIGREPMSACCALVNVH